MFWYQEYPKLSFHKCGGCTMLVKSCFSAEMIRNAVFTVVEVVLVCLSSRMS